MSTIGVENVDINFDPSETDNLNVNIETEDLRLNLDFGAGIRYGTYDYNELFHHPEINGVELIGNKSLADLGIETLIDTKVQEATQTYIHNQLSASDTWVIEHNLRKKPSVTVVDSGDSVVIGEVTYINDNKISISFAAAFSGKAYLN